MLLDSFLSARLGPGLEIYTRPFVQRLGTGEWNRQVWLAAVRYERKGRGGPAHRRRPDSRADRTRQPDAAAAAQPHHLAAVVALPGAARRPSRSARGSRCSARIYPFGVSATVSGAKWDARAAVIDVSPLRARRIFGDVNPPRFANVVVGGGVTPIIGLRFGASVTRGGWKRAGERPASDGTLDATIVTVETEFAFRYTKLAGEYTRDILTTTTGEAVSAGWYVQGQQTLTPRWFAAARVERIGAPEHDPLLAPVVERVPRRGGDAGLPPDARPHVPPEPPRAPAVRPDRLREPGAGVDRLGSSVVLSQAPGPGLQAPAEPKA